MIEQWEPRPRFVCRRKSARTRSALGKLKNYSPQYSGVEFPSEEILSRMFGPVWTDDNNAAYSSLCEQITAGPLEIVEFDKKRNAVELRYVDVGQRNIKTVRHRSRHDSDSYGQGGGNSGDPLAMMGSGDCPIPLAQPWSDAPARTSAPQRRSTAGGRRGPVPRFSSHPPCPLAA